MKDSVRHIWYFACKHLLSILPDKVFFNIQYNVTCIRYGYKMRWLNINNPKRFNEKIHWLKLNPCIKNGDILADKFKVRDYIKKTIGETYLIPLIGVWENIEDIDFEKLPNKFALKANHGSGMNIICRDKNNLSWNKIKQKLKFWLENSQYCISREWQYKNTPRKIICEEFLEYDITDYKFFSFNGEPKYIQVDVDRFENHTRAFYTTNWELAPFTTLYKHPQKEITRPKELDEMLNIAKTLAKDYSFVRIDLYIHHNKIYFGEITLHPEGGCGVFIPDEYDYILGNLIKL